MERVYTKIRNGMRNRNLPASALNDLVSKMNKDLLTYDTDIRTCRSLRAAMEYDTLTPKEAYDILKYKRLFEMLRASGVDVGMFAIAFANYISIKFNLNLNINISEEDFDSAGSQQIYNGIMKRCMDVLGVFYD